MGAGWAIFKQSLNVGQVLLITIFILALMVALSVLQTRYRELGWVFKPAPLPEPSRSSGD